MSSNWHTHTRTRTHTLREVVISVPQTTLTGVLSLERDPRSLPFTKQRQGPFCPSRDPRPIISTDYRWPVWQPYWLRERLFHLVPRSVRIFNRKRKYSAILSLWFERRAAKMKKKKKTLLPSLPSSTPFISLHLFPLSLSLSPYTFSFCVVQWKAFVCCRSYCSLINGKLVETRCLSHQLGL